MKHQETPYWQVAFQFSQALLNGQFPAAYSLLGSSICNQWNPSLLRHSYENMIEYFQTPPNEIAVEIVDTQLLANMPGSAWVYVSIIGDGDLEAVTLIIGNEDDKYLIQNIEWGRP
jgi:hypothetical protein